MAERGGGRDGTPAEVPPDGDGRGRRSARRRTLSDVAQAAGVSLATASRVINGFRYISPEVKSAVERAVQDLGYVPNRAARTLVTRRTDSVALVICEDQERLYADPYFGIMARAVTMALADTDVQLVLLMARTDRQRQRVVRYAVNGHVDGVLITSVHGDDPLPRALVDAGVPVVLNGPPAQTGVPLYVDADNANAAARAARYLKEAGRRRITTIAGPPDLRSAVDRLEGFRRGLGRLPRTAVAHGDHGLQGGRAAMRTLLERIPDLDAVFVASDQMAIGALGVLRASGRRVPDDVAVIGFDDIPDAAFSDPPLTTFHQPFDEMARAMVDLLLGQIQGGQDTLEPVVLPVDLVIRESA